MHVTLLIDKSYSVADNMVCLTLVSSSLLAPSDISIRAAPLIFGCILLTLMLCQAIRLRKTPNFIKGYDLIKLLVGDQIIYYTL